MKQFLKKRWYIFVIILVVLVLVVFQLTASKTQSNKGLTYIVKRQDLKETLSLSGTIDADEHTILKFQSSGKLVWVGVKEGDYVKKYQTIASLDQRQMQMQLKKYLLTYQNDRSSFDQSQDDNKTDLVDLSVDLRHKAQRLISESQANLDSSVVDVELQNLTLEYANLYTPIEGIITRIDSPFAGVNITPAQAEFEIINPKTIYFSATADQSDVVSLKEGMHGDIILDSYPDQPITGTVKSIAFVPKTGETGTVYEVKMALNTNDTDNKYRFGMTGDIDFTVREKDNVLAVPSSYVKTDKGKKYVMKKNNDSTIKTYVETGDQIDDNTIITSGLKENDVVYD